MRLGIMQPYFLPYLGYFALIQQVDAFILFDTPQFIRHGWIERNQILKQNGEKLYIKVPLQKHSRETAIKDVVINEEQNWQQTILSQLGPYKKRAPYFKMVTELLEKIFVLETQSIVALNKRSLEVICGYLEIDTPIQVFSQMELEVAEVNAPDEWALNICKALGANSYYNPTGGMEFFSREKYQNEGIELKFLEFKASNYEQLGNPFVPYLSVLDVMMFNSPAEINKMMEQINLLD
ncbi:WbqC family protein [Gilvibacter sp.]|uniref:WbqC family protein n=1 Tax=Gilvibacter sp. TaxID=2729997 RepID=UPI003F4A4C1E